MQQGDEAETVVTLGLLLNAHPAGAKEKDNVRCRNLDERSSRHSLSAFPASLTLPS